MRERQKQRLTTAPYPIETDYQKCKRFEKMKEEEKQEELTM